MSSKIKSKGSGKASLRERLIQKKKDLQSSAQGGDVFSIKEGVTRFRHLPVPEEQEFAIELKYIFLNKDLGGFICPSTWGEKSAFKIWHDKLSSSKADSDREFAKEKLRIGTKFGIPSFKYLDEDGKKVDEKAGTKLLLITSSLYQEVIDYYLDKEQGDFTDENEGYDLKYERTGKGLTDTRYSVRPCKPTKLPKMFRGKTWNPEELAKAITPSYAKTKELMEIYMNAREEDLDDKKSAKSSKNKKDKKKKNKKRI